MLNRNPKARPHRWMKPQNYKKMTREKKLAVAYNNDWMSVKALRKFVTGFDAKDGYTLNAVHSGNLHSSMKAKIRRYSLEYRPEIVAINSGNYVLKHYRNKERMRAAIEASQQEARPARNQRNAVFYTRNKENFKIKVRRGRKGISQFYFSDALYQNQIKLRFSDPAFLKLLSDKAGYVVEEWSDVLGDQPELIAETVQEMLPGFRRYKLLTGKYSSVPVKAAEWEEYIVNEAMKYGDDEGNVSTSSVAFIFGAQGIG